LKSKWLKAMEDNSKKILIIDDQPENLNILNLLIADFDRDFVVFATDNGYEGIELAKIQQPDLILLDIVMPDMDGFTVCKALKEDGSLKDIPVVLVTGYAQFMENMERAIEVGAEGILKKPFDKKELFIHIKAMLKRKSANDFKKSKTVEIMHLIADQTKALQLKQQQLSEAQAIANIGHWHFDLIQNTLEWSDEVYRIFELKPAEIEPSYGVFLKFIHPDERTMVDNSYRTSVEKHTPYDMEHRLVLDGGIVKYVTQKCATFYDDDGTPLRSIGTIMDITGRKRLELELASERNRLAAILEGTNAGTWEWNVQTGETIYNERWAEIIGYTLKEISPVSIETWIRFAHPDDLRRSNELLEAHFRGEIPFYEFESRMKHKNGEWVWVLDKGKVVSRTSDGKPLMMYGTHIDITTRKQSEQFLQESETQFKGLFYQAADAIFIADVESGIIIHANQNASKLLKCPLERIIGKHQSELHPPELKKENEEAFKRQIDEIAEIGRSFPVESRVLCSNGDENPVEIIASKVLFKGKACLMGIFRDISERKQAEIELRQAQKFLAEKESQYRLIAENATDLIYKYSLIPEPHYAYISPSCYQLTGYKPEEGYRDPLVYHKFLNTPEGVEKFTQFLMDPSQPTTIEEVWQRKDGKKIWVEQAVSREYDKEGALISFQSTVRDITDRKLIEEALKGKELKFRTLFENSADAIIVIEGEKFIDCNHQTLEMYGCQTYEQFIGKTPFDFSPAFQPNGKPSKEYADEVMNAAYEGQTQVFQWLHIKLDGTPFHAEVKLNKLELNNQILLQAIVRDITKRIEAEQSLQQASDIINNMQMGLYVYELENLEDDRTLKMVATNRASGILSGVLPDEIIGKYIDEIFPGLRAMGIPKRFAEVVRTGEAGEFEDFYYQDDRVLQAAYSVKAFPLPNQRVGITFDNITDRKKTQEALDLQVRVAAGFLRTSDEEMFQESLKIIRELTESPFGFFGYLEEDGSLKVPTLTKQIWEGKHPFEGDVIFPRSKWGDSSWGRAINEAASNYSNEASLKTPMEHVPLKRHMNIPILMNNNVIGLFSVANAENDYTENTVQLLESIANQIAPLLNARLERNRAEKALVESNEYLNNLFNYANAPIIVWDNDFRITRYNHAFEVLTGRKSEEVIGEHIELLFPEESKESTLELIEKAALGAYWEVIEIKIAHVSGVEHTLIWNSANIKNAEGKITATIAQGQDITKRKKAEKELIKAKEKAEENEKQLRYSQEVARIGYYVFDIQTGFWTSSKMLDDIFGINSEFVRDVNGWNELVHPDDQKEMLDYFTANVVLRHEKFDKKYRIINRLSRQTYWVHGLGTLEFDNNGNLLRMFGTIQDITEIKKYEEELIIAKEKAEESDRLKSAFLANMSHEIRTPMNGILGFAELLKEPDLTGEEQLTFINLINKSGQRMLNIINDIVDISKIEAGLMEVHLSESNVNDQMEYIYNFFHPEASSKGLLLTIKNWLASKDATFKTDREKLYAILTNLVKNALKYTHVGGIEMGCSRKNNFIEFFVKDTGIGIPADRHQAVFERFVQADIEDRMAYQGAGLGLTISKTYVNTLGGEIWLESQENMGTTFYFTLPYTVEETTKAGEIPTLTSELFQTERKLKILVVEDDQTSEVLLRKTISKITEEILVAHTGLEAIEMCRNNPDTDLILMDIRMPQMGGYEATRQIRLFNKNVIIIAQTAFAIVGDREKAREAGCDDYITKPIDRSELLAMIQKYLVK